MLRTPRSICNALLKFVSNFATRNLRVRVCVCACACECMRACVCDDTFELYHIIWFLVMLYTYVCTMCIS